MTLLPSRPMTIIRPVDKLRNIADITARDLLLTILNRRKPTLRNVAISYRIHRLLCAHGRQITARQLAEIKGLKPPEINRLLAALELSRRYERRVD